MRTATDIEQLSALLDPYLHAEIGTHFHGGSLGMRAASPPFTVHGIVRADRVHAPEGAPAKDVRAAMLASVEEALAALDAAGWQLTRYPSMEFTGDLDRAAITLAGEMVQAARQRGIGLHVSFGAEKLRVPALRSAPDPEPSSSSLPDGAYWIESCPQSGGTTTAGTPVTWTVHAPGHVSAEDLRAAVRQAIVEQDINWRGGWNFPRGRQRDPMHTPPGR